MTASLADVATVRLAEEVALDVAAADLGQGTHTWDPHAYRVITS